MKRFVFAFSLALLLAGAADAQEPRKGGTIRMTAPYGTNLSTLDMHATVRAQDDIYGHAVHRTLKLGRMPCAIIEVSFCPLLRCIAGSLVSERLLRYGLGRRHRPHVVILMPMGVPQLPYCPAGRDCRQQYRRGGERRKCGRQFNAAHGAILWMDDLSEGRIVSVNARDAKEVD